MTDPSLAGQTEDRPDRFDAKQRAAIDAVAAVIEDPESGDFPAQRVALLEALTWLEAGALCGDCLEGRCHNGSETSRAAAECGCGRHEISVRARHRRARLNAAGLAADLPA